MSRKIELHLTSDPSLLSIMRAAVSQICQIAGFGQMETSKIVLALDEACSNIIRHAYKGKKGQPIIISCKLKPSKLEFEIIDNGEPADVKKIKSRKLDELRPGGLGVYLMKSVMDEVRYTSETDDGNHLVMCKLLPKGKCE